MKQQLLADLIAHLSVEPGTSAWEHERQRLLAEVQTVRDAIPAYQSRVSYRLERHYIKSETVIDGETVCQEESYNIGKHTTNTDRMRAIVRTTMEQYPLGELRLYHGSRRIRDILGWLSSENESQ